MSEKPQGRTSAPDEVWARVQEDYLAGMSGPDCCRRHGVSLSALRNRAAREGWRRSDQAWIPPQSLDPWDEGRILEERICGNLDLIEWGELSGVAEGRMMRAVLRGDSAEFMRWHKVAEIIQVREAELRRWAEEEEARKYQIRQRARDIEAEENERDNERDSGDYLDSEFDECLEDQGPVRGFTITRDGELIRQPRPDGSASSDRRERAELEEGDTLPLSSSSDEESAIGGRSGACEREPVADTASVRRSPSAPVEPGDDESKQTYPFGLPVAGSVAVSPELLDPLEPAGSVAGRGD